MVNAYSKLWNRDFSLIILVQVLALFGNSILSFALPLHILNITGSPALFGTVLALSFVPLIVMSPVGGVIADRRRKQRIMFCLDTITAVLIVLFIVLNRQVTSVTVIVTLVIVKVMALNVVQGLYMPTTMSAVPFLVPASKLVPANAIATSVFSLSNIVGPVVGGILYATFEDLFPILVISIAIFVAAAVIDLFIRIPYKEQESAGGIMSMLKNDLSRCARFATREKPILGKVVFAMFLFGIPSLAMVIVGLPVLITQTLDMPMNLFGLSQGIMMGGGLLGSILVGTLEKKLTIQKAHWLLFACSMSIAPIGLVLLFGVPETIAYVVITLSGALIMLTTQIVTIQILAFIQLETPRELVGKIIAVAMALILGSYPVGQLLFGVLLEWFYAKPWIVIFVAVFMAGAVAVYSREHFRKIDPTLAALNLTVSGDCQKK